jgi:hypothetical protein
MKLIVKSIPNQFGAYKKIKNVYWGTRPFGFFFFIFFFVSLTKEICINETTHHTFKNS